MGLGALWARLTCVSQVRITPRPPKSPRSSFIVRGPASRSPRASTQIDFPRSTAVLYPYQIGKFEVSNAQYAEFLNAVDPTGANALGLYNRFMGSNERGGITNAGAEGFVYQVKPFFESKPVVYVSFWDSIRFANWLHNGQGNADMETGSYTITEEGIDSNTITRNVNATIALPSEDEWYKAAYYDSGSESYYDRCRSPRPNPPARDRLPRFRPRAERSATMPRSRQGSAPRASVRTHVFSSSRVHYAHRGESRRANAVLRQHPPPSELRCPTLASRNVAT